MDTIVRQIFARALEFLNKTKDSVPFKLWGPFGFSSLQPLTILCQTLDDTRCTREISLFSTTRHRAYIDGSNGIG